MEAAALGKRKRDSAAAAGDSSASCDRLSALPDHLLHEILSRLKARQMVHTCVLSRRWRHLWPKSPRLDVDQSEFAAAGLGDQRFDDFANFLLQQAPIANLDAFRLYVNPCSVLLQSNASAWVRRAIMASAQRPPPEAQRSWRLKRLHLSNLCLGGDFAEHVASRCPSLQDLELVCCTCQFGAIASGSVRSLELVFCAGKGFSGIATPALRSLIVYGGNSDATSSSPFAVSAPALASLSLDVTPFNFPCGVSFDEMASLATASVRLKERGRLVKIMQLRDHMFTLRSMSNATSLELSGFDIEVEEAGEESTAFPEFNNLRTLELNQCGLGNDLRQVSGHILRNSPNLEKLTLHLLPGWTKVLVGKPLSYPKLKNMRVLILHHYDPSHDFQTLVPFLRSSPILEKLTLHCSKFLIDAKKKKGSSKTKNMVQNLMDVQCENLKLTEIIYKDDDVSHLVDFFFHFSRNLPNNKIRPIKID